jgi:hypothetical protein
VRPALLALLLAACTTSSGTSQVTATAPDPRGNTLRASPNVPLPGRPIPMPVKFLEHRFFVQPMTEDGATLLLFTDTGGGLMLSREAAERMSLSVSSVEGDGGEAMDAALLPAMVWDAWIPPITVFDGRMPVRPARELQMIDRDVDGLLGQAWFKERVWTFDYGEGQLLLRAQGDLPTHEPAHRAFLGFPRNAAGERGANYPRIEVQVDGQTIDLLFDTGATVKLTPAALASLGDGKGVTRATSFISASTFKSWQEKHPDWRVIEGADANLGGEPMIEVPALTVAGFTVGPVWFTRREDKNFHEWMSQWMDKKIDGALGGSALKYFRVTVDYPRAMAVFELLEGAGTPATKPAEP